jgi:hypothetical protein
MALIEASAKFFSAVHKRLHHAQRQQFKILAQINETFVPVNGYPYATPEGDMTIFQQDFDGRVDVLPVSDPNIPSRAHRLSLASLALQLAAQTPPGTFNNTELIRQVLEAADFPNIDQVIPAKQEAQPADPVTDIMNATKGMPIAAFPGQDHESHIQVKTNFLQDPTAGASEAFKQFAPIHSGQHSGTHDAPVQDTDRGCCRPDGTARAVSDGRTAGNAGRNHCRGCCPSCHGEPADCQCG